MWRPAIPRLMLVTDPGRTQQPLADLAAAAVAGGVDAVYVRGVTEPEVTQAVCDRIDGMAMVLVNDPADAVRHPGTGLHLRERDLQSWSRPQCGGGAALIGRSVHSLEVAAVSTDVDYLLAGHVYPSASKPGKPPLGLERFAAIVAAASCPVLAIGGMTPGRVAAVIAAGAHGVAVIGAISEADDPRAAAQALRTALDEALAARHGQEESSMNETGAKAATIEIVVNGKAVAVSPGDTVHDFLASKRMTDQMAIVEHNGEIVPRGAYGVTPLQAGDRLEVVHAVGGG